MALFNSVVSVDLLVVVLVMALAIADASRLRTTKQQHHKVALPDALSPQLATSAIAATTVSTNPRTLLQHHVIPSILQDEAEAVDDNNDGDTECSGCDYSHDPTCQTCLQQEHLIVVCGSCFYSNECFALQAGKDPTLCKIVGVDP